MLNRNVNTSPKHKNIFFVLNQSDNHLIILSIILLPIQYKPSHKIIECYVCMSMILLSHISVLGLHPNNYKLWRPCDKQHQISLVALFRGAAPHS